MYEQDRIRIEILVNNYFEGLYYGDTNKLKSCFYTNSHLYGDVKGKSFSKNLHSYFEDVEKRQSPKELNEEFKMKIIDMDIMGKIAMVKLHVPMLGYNYYDYLSIVNISNEWKIVNKIFAHVE